MVQCTELVPAVAAGVIQWARTHWPAEMICESVELCDAAMLSTSQVILPYAARIFGTQMVPDLQWPGQLCSCMQAPVSETVELCTQY